MDIKKTVEEAVAKLTKDKSLLEQFQKNPVQTLEKTLGVDLPDDVMDKVVTGVKGKLTVDKLSGAADALKKLF